MNLSRRRERHPKKEARTEPRLHCHREGSGLRTRRAAGRLVGYENRTVVVRGVITGMPFSLLVCSGRVPDSLSGF